jgi:hypothetical protein
MIERTSRYYDGPLAQTQNKYTGKYEISVFRKFPDTQEVTFFTYMWVEGDTLSKLASTYLGNPKYWWEIVDINPNITDPFNITPGTILKVPNG